MIGGDAGLVGTAGLGGDAKVSRMVHLEKFSYQRISSELCKNMQKYTEN